MKFCRRIRFNTCDALSKFRLNRTKDKPTSKMSFIKNIEIRAKKENFLPLNILNQKLDTFVTFSVLLYLLYTQASKKIFLNTINPCEPAVSNDPRLYSVMMSTLKKHLQNL